MNLLLYARQRTVSADGERISVGRVASDPLQFGRVEPAADGDSDEVNAGTTSQVGLVVRRKPISRVGVRYDDRSLRDGRTSSVCRVEHRVSKVVECRRHVRTVASQE